jgi:hypothetical protein
MNHDPTRVDEALDAFLEEGPREVDDTVIEAALARISTTPQRSRVSRRWTMPRWLAAAAVLLVVASALVARQLASPSPSPLASPSPTAGWPVGGPVPPGIAGLWSLRQQPPVTFAISLNLRGDQWAIGGSTIHNSGNVVVDGDTILFFNGTGCQLSLPAGIGTYHWSLSGTGTLSLTLVSDPCGGRVDNLGDSTWDRIR